MPEPMTTCLAGRCDNCGFRFLIPARTPLDMLVTCPECEYVTEAEEYFAAYHDQEEAAGVPA